jgi:hypothetical protein
MFSSLAIFLLAAWFTFWRMSKSEERKERRYWSDSEVKKRIRAEWRKKREELAQMIQRTFEDCKDNILKDQSIDEHEKQKKLEELQAWYESMVEENKKQQNIEANWE